MAVDSTLTMNREKEGPNFERVPVSLAPAVAKKLNRNAFTHEVSKSGFVEAAVQELMKRTPTEIAHTLKKYGIGKRRKV